jgi:hypothetical protein
VKALLIGALFLLGGAAFADNSIDGDPDPGGFWLSRIQLQGNVLILTRSDQDLGFFFQMGKLPAQPSRAGSVWRLQRGMEGRFFGHESSLRMVPFPADSPNLFLTEETNRRDDVHIGLLRQDDRQLRPFKKKDGNVVYVGLRPSRVPVDSPDALAKIEAQVRRGTFKP